MKYPYISKSTTSRKSLSIVRSVLPLGFTKNCQLSIVLFFLFFFQAIVGQDLQETKKLYSEGNYAGAKAGAEKLVKASPTNASYNQWYGVCLFETGEYNASKKYLEFAAGKGIQESFRYLGQLNYLQYNFDESVRYYEKYTDALKKKKQTKEIEVIEPLIEQAKKADRMLSYTEDVQFIDSIIVDKDDFLNYYKLSEESGSIVASEDGKVSIYTNQLANKRYYARLDANSIYKLYSQNKLLDKWSDETILSDVVNSPEDNNYPFVLSDGVTVYFASKGHGSIGGYDLFVTRYNNTNDTYLTPEQMGMPFNSIGNDYMLAIDDLNGVGYFATDRFLPEDKVIIYTFIPNAERISVDKENLNVLKERAMITSIRASWKEGENYSSLLEKIHNRQITSSPEKKKDFTFIVNDNIVYYSLSDFESDAAKSQFMEAQQLKNKLDALEKNLENNRIEYSKGSASTKRTLKDTILNAEKSEAEMQKKYENLLVSVRNTEIKHLRQQNK